MVDRKLNIALVVNNQDVYRDKRFQIYAQHRNLKEACDIYRQVALGKNSQVT